MLILSEFMDQVILVHQGRHFLGALHQKGAQLILEFFRRGGFIQSVGGVIKVKLHFGFIIDHVMFQGLFTTQDRREEVVIEGQGGNLIKVKAFNKDGRLQFQEGAAVDVGLLGKSAAEPVIGGLGWLGWNVALKDPIDAGFGFIQLEITGADQRGFIHNSSSSSVGCLMGSALWVLKKFRSHSDSCQQVWA